MWTEHVLEALEQQLEAQVFKPCRDMCSCCFSAWGKQIWAQRLCTMDATIHWTQHRVIGLLHRWAGKPDCASLVRHVQAVCACLI